VDISAEAEKGFGVFENLHTFGSAAAFSNTLIKLSATYYGSAAIAFLQRITQEEYFTRLPLLIKVIRDNFLAKNLPENSSGQVYRVCERFGLIAAAGELATDLSITGWESGEAEKAASVCFRIWLKCRGGAGNQENVRILSQVKAFFEAHAESRFSHWQVDSSRTINRAGFRKTLLNHETQFYVLPEVFRQEICRGWDFHMVAKLLLAEGWIEPDHQGKAYRREYLPNIGRSRCYVFTNKMWG
jgi:putative DNA primase/helicase